MELILELDIEKQTRLKNKINFNFPKPKKKGIKKKIALFDLDETLVHCTGDINIKKEYQHAIEIKLPGKQAVKVGINLRPCWKQTLNLIKKLYHIVIYTASHQAYADSVLDFMDPKKKYFKYRLYRNNCSLIDIDGAKFYVKDLDILNKYYDLKDIVIIDNSVLSFAYHLHNGIPIIPYYDEDKDGSLYVVGLYLLHIFPEDDLREANKKQINLDSFLEEAKKETENIIDEESNDEEEVSKNSNKKNIIGTEEDKCDKKLGNTQIQKNSDKTITKNKKKFCSQSPVLHRSENTSKVTQKKLMSQSKLIKMYYEVNDESTKTAHYKHHESKEEKKNSDKYVNNLNILNLNSDTDTNKIDNNSFSQNKLKLNCKSDPGDLLFDINFNYSDGDGLCSYDNVKKLKRGFTIKEDILKKDIKGKLQFIRSNFYNKFKI
jgi:Dullard-like phosphatase family protein